MLSESFHRFSDYKMSCQNMLLFNYSQNLRLKEKNIVYAIHISCCFTCSEIWSLP